MIREVHPWSGGDPFVVARARHRAANLSKILRFSSVIACSAKRSLSTARSKLVEIRR
jgi:hypothetical protein